MGALLCSPELKAALSQVGAHIPVLGLLSLGPRQVTDVISRQTKDLIPLRTGTCHAVPHKLMLGRGVRDGDGLRVVVKGCGHTQPAME